MSNEQLLAVAEAAREFEDDGIVSTTTFIALTASGLDAEATIEEISNG